MRWSWEGSGEKCTAFRGECREPAPRRKAAPTGKVRYQKAPWDPCQEIHKQFRSSKQHREDLNLQATTAALGSQQQDQSCVLGKHPGSPRLAGNWDSSPGWANSWGESTAPAAPCFRSQLIHLNQQLKPAANPARRVTLPSCRSPEVGTLVPSTLASCYSPWLPLKSLFVCPRANDQSTTAYFLLCLKIFHGDVSCQFFSPALDKGQPAARSERFMFKAEVCREKKLCLEPGQLKEIQERFRWSRCRAHRYPRSEADGPGHSDQHPSESAAGRGISLFVINNLIQGKMRSEQLTSFPKWYCSPCQRGLTPNDPTMDSIHEVF